MSLSFVFCDDEEVLGECVWGGDGKIGRVMPGSTKVIHIFLSLLQSESWEDKDVKGPTGSPNVDIFCLGNGQEK